MGRIVRDHYPVDRLPEDLREGLSLGTEVRVTVESIEVEATPATPGGGRRSRHFSGLRSLARANGQPTGPSEVGPSIDELIERRLPTFSTGAEVDAYVQALRDEWT